MNVWGWVGSWNWGDVPSWLSLVLTIGVAVLAYLKRSGIMAWFKRVFNAPPDFESQPSWTFSQGSGFASREITLTNHGPGIAYDVRAKLRSFDSSADFVGQYNFDSVRSGAKIKLVLADDPTANTFIKVSWILRVGERDSKEWRLSPDPF